MVQKNSPAIFDLPHPALFADLEGLELGEALQSAPHSEPGDQYTGQQQNRRPRNQRFSPAAARPDQNRQQAELYASVSQFAHPVDLSIEGELLEDPKDGDDKPQRQQEPDEAPPLLERAK